jgi:Na+/alanine symporter
MQRQRVLDGLKVVGLVVLAAVVWGAFTDTALFRALNELVMAAMYLPMIFGIIIIFWGVHAGLSGYFQKAFGKKDDHNG